jgi:hypothetical protein
MKSARVESSQPQRPPLQLEAIKLSILAFPNRARNFY